MTDTPKDVTVHFVDNGLTGVAFSRDLVWAEQHHEKRFTHNPHGTLRETIECDECDGDGNCLDWKAINGLVKCAICLGTGRRVKP